MQLHMATVPKQQRVLPAGSLGSLRGAQPFTGGALPRPSWQPLRSSPRQARQAARAGLGFGKLVQKKPSETKTCPCGSGLEYEKCCQPYHSGAAEPAAPEALMRARYSAYAKGLVDYVVKTTHPENSLQPGQPGSTLADDVRATCDKIGWERLKVLSTEEGSTPDEGFVTFQTWFKVRKQIGQRQKGSHTQTFVERSRFLRHDGRWLYVDGDQDWTPSSK